MVRDEGDNKLIKHLTKYKMILWNSITSWGESP